MEDACGSCKVLIGTFPLPHIGVQSWNLSSIRQLINIWSTVCAGMRKNCLWWLTDIWSTTPVLPVQSWLVVYADKPTLIRHRMHQLTIKEVGSFDKHHLGPSSRLACLIRGKPVVGLPFPVKITGSQLNLSVSVQCVTRWKYLQNARQRCVLWCTFTTRSVLGQKNKGKNKWMLVYNWFYWRRSLPWVCIGFQIPP